MSARNSIFKNGLATAAQRLIRVLDQLLLVPFFLSSWGAAYYGEWLTLTIIPSVLAFSDLGLGTAAGNTFVLRYASGDRLGAASTARNGIFIISITIVFSLLVGSLLLYFLDLFEVFDRSLIPKNDAMLSVALLMAARLAAFYQQMFEAYFRAARKAALGTLLSSVFSGVNILTAAAVLSFGGGIVEFSVASLLVAVLFNVYYAWKAGRVLGMCEKCPHRINKEEVMSIARKGFGFLLTPVWQAIYFQGTTLAIRISLGAEAVAIFNTVRTVCRAANQTYSMVNGSFFPEIQFELGAGNWEKVRSLFRMALCCTIFIAVLGMSGLIVFGPSLYSVWTGNTLSPPPGMWNLLILGIGFNAVWWTASVVFRATNRPYEIATIGVIGATISVILSYFLSKVFGLNGAAMGSLILDIVMAIYVLPKGCSLLGQKLNRLPKECRQDILFQLKKINGIRTSIK